MGDSQTQRKGIMKHIDERLVAAFARQEEAYGGLIKRLWQAGAGSGDRHSHFRHQPVPLSSPRHRVHAHHR